MGADDSEQGAAKTALDIGGFQVVAMIRALRRAQRRSTTLELRLLNSRVQRAEALLAEEQERLHQLRAAVSGVVASNRLLTEHRLTVSASVKQRLERLQGIELSRIERLLEDQATQPPTTIDLGGVLDTVVDSVRLRGHPVRWRGTRHRVLARADDVAEIALILLDNASRHAGGHSIAVDVTDRGDWFELRVSDEGPGVPLALFSAVFGSGSRRSGSSGDGVGLHIARRLARGLGGDIRLDPYTPKGAAFTVQLPKPPGASPCLVPAV